MDLGPQPISPLYIYIYITSTKPSFPRRYSSPDMYSTYIAHFSPRTCIAFKQHIFLPGHVQHLHSTFSVLFFLVWLQGGLVGSGTRRDVLHKSACMHHSSYNEHQFPSLLFFALMGSLEIGVVVPWYQRNKQDNFTNSALGESRHLGMIAIRLKYKCMLVNRPAFVFKLRLCSELPGVDRHFTYPSHSFIRSAESI